MISTNKIQSAQDYLRPREKPLGLSVPQVHNLLKTLFKSKQQNHLTNKFSEQKHPKKFSSYPGKPVDN